MKNEKQEFNLVQHPAEAEVGDYATVESLFRAGGKFYAIRGNEVERSLCDTGTGTWELEDPSDPGYRRIE